MAVTKTRLDKATDLIVGGRVDYDAGARELVVASTSGSTYRIALMLGAEGVAWRCGCDWGDVHSYEAGNECSHALAARYYARDHGLSADDLAGYPSKSTDDGDPFAGL